MAYQSPLPGYARLYSGKGKKLVQLKASPPPKGRKSTKVAAKPPPRKKTAATATSKSVRARGGQMRIGSSYSLPSVGQRAVGEGFPG